MIFGKFGATARIVAATALCLAIWALAKHDYAKPKVQPVDAPATLFSAGRAEATLAHVLGPERPHPVSSDENAAVRGRILAEFAKLGVKTSTYRAFACNTWRGFRNVECATVTDILAEVVPGAGRAIVLLAHYDSVPAGPGASDDESGVATVLETARALSARAGNSLHPVLAVLTDGEEAGLLGAEAFLNNPALKARVGAVINVEARGTDGRSLLFQTSPGDGRLIDLYARSVPFYGTSSLYAEIYRVLPNDTDLTLFIRQGFPSFNFAFSDNVADYHTAFDRRENLSRLTLQEHGENMLGIAASLEKTNYADLSGTNDIYLDLFGAVLPRMPAAWALPIALVTLLLLVGAVFRSHGTRRSNWVLAFLMPPALLIACGLTGLALHFIAQTISGQPDPSYAYPIALREGLAFGVLATTLFVARMAAPRPALLAVWVWFASLGVVTAAFLPGISPYFLFPTMLAALAALAIIVAPDALKGRLGNLAFAAATLVALAIWLGLVASGETLMGLKLHPLFTAPAAFATMTLIPYLNARAMSSRAWVGCIAVGVAGALIATIIAGLQPAFSRNIAQRLSIRYVQDAAAKGARWVLDGGAPLPPSLRAVAAFSKDPQPVLSTLLAPAYVAPAGEPQFAAARGEIDSDAATPKGRRVEIALHGSPQTSTMILVIPKSAKLASIDIRGQHLAAPTDNNDDTILVCYSRDCAEMTFTLDLAAHTGFALQFAEERYSLPSSGAALVAARPRTAVPSQNGDVTLIVNALKVPAR